MPRVDQRRFPNKLRVVSYEKRQALINACEQDQDVYKLVAVKQIMRDTAHRLVKRYQETGSQGPAPNKSGVRRKVTPEVLAFLEEVLDKQPDQILKEMTENIQETGFLKVHPSTIHKHLQVFQTNEPKQ